MSRPKPYARNDRNSTGGTIGGTTDRGTERQWKHDLHHTVRETLADRLSGTATTPSSSTSSSASAPKLLARLSGGGAGKELIGASASSSRGKLHGFDGPSASGSVNAGKELLPPKAARPARSSRDRGSGGVRRVDATAHPLVAQGLGALARTPPRRAHRAGSGASTPVSAAAAVSIMGAAGATLVRVEFLARGTTAADVKSAFAPTPITSAKLISGPRDATATVELEVGDRASADALVAQYDGVVADGETLRVAVIVPAAAAAAQALPPRSRRGAGASLSSRIEATAAPVPPSGKMYSDNIGGNATHAAAGAGAGARATTTGARRADSGAAGRPRLQQTSSAASLAARLSSR